MIRWRNPFFPKKIQIRVASYLTLAAALIVFLVCYLNISEQLKFRELVKSSHNWLESEAILLSTVTLHSGSAYISYRYNFQGSSLMGYQTTLDDGVSLSPSEQSTLENDYLTQKRVPVYINPENPSQTVLFLTNPPPLISRMNIFWLMIFFMHLIILFKKGLKFSIHEGAQKPRICDQIS